MCKFILKYVRSANRLFYNVFLKKMMQLLFLSKNTRRQKFNRHAHEMIKT